MDQNVITGLGYLAILTGTVIEGETVLIAAGFAAQRGYLSLPLVLLAAWAGAASGDHFFFVLGRCKGKVILELRPSWNGRIDKALGLIERYGTAVILSARFLYGFRAIGPFAVGTAHVRASRFVSFNLLSSLVWTLLYGSAGYLFGTALGRRLTDARFLLALLCVILCAAASLRYRSSFIRLYLHAVRCLRSVATLAGRLRRVRGYSPGYSK